MCQSSKNGGKRCAVHMHGSRAMSKLTAITVKITTDDANGILRDLRKEGKNLNLSTPTPEQVRAFAEVQKRNVQNDPMITPREKNMINKNLDEAAQEQPNGSVFYSWKNAVAEGMSRFMKKPAVKVSAVLLASTMAMSTVAACGNNTEPAPTGNPTPTISAPATETPTESPTTETPADNPITTTSGVVPGQAVNDGVGDYQQITLADDSFVLQYDETLVTGEDTLQSFSPEEILDAQRVVMPFIVEESLDSTLLCNSTVETRAAWVQEHGDFFAPESKDVLVADALAPKGGLVQKSTDENDQQWRGDCIYTGGTRIKSVELGPQAIYRTTDGDLGFHVAGTMTREVTAPGTRGQEGTQVYLETTTFDVKLGVRKSDDGSTWVLTGSDTQFNTNTVEAPPVG